MKIALIGAGQQGVSQGLAYIQAGHDVVFCDIDPEREQEILKKASEFGISQGKLQFTTSMQVAIKDAELIGANVPGDQFRQVAEAVAEYAKDDTIFYDNGSGKTKTMHIIKDALGDALKRIHYVGAHFFVGSAGSGPKFADPEMYKNQTAAVFGQGTAVDVLKDLFEGDLGVANVRTDLTPEQHDRDLGFFSHHNTLAVTALMLAFPQTELDGKDIQMLRFLSSTRVAEHGEAGHLFWKEILKDNREAILESADIFSAQISAVKEALKADKKAGLDRLFQKSSAYVDQISEDRAHEGVAGDMHDLQQMGLSEDPAVIAEYSAMPIIFGVLSAGAGETYEENGSAFSTIGNSSYKDSIRPARSDADAVEHVWKNKRAVLASIGQFEKNYSELVDLLKVEDYDALEKCFIESHQIRIKLAAAPNKARPELAIG